MVCGVCRVYAREGREQQFFMSKYLHIFHSFERIKHFGSLWDPQESSEHLLFQGVSLSCVPVSFLQRLLHYNNALPASCPLPLFHSPVQQLKAEHGLDTFAAALSELL